MMTLNPSFLVLMTCFAVASVATAAAPFVLGINIDPKNRDGFPSQANLTLLGAVGVRIEYKDTAGGTPVPDPAAVAYYQAVFARFSPSTHVLVILDYSMLPGFPAPTDPDQAWETYTTNFAARAGVLAAKFGSSVDAYEIWNEEDLAPQPGYNVYVPPSRYACILAGARASVRQFAPHATVVMGGLASGDPTYVTQVKQAACSGGTLPADAVGVHPYGRRPTQDWPSSSWGFGVITDLMASYYSASGVPTWITEVGTNDMSVQAQFPDKTFAAMAADMAGCNTQAVFWFCWSDGMVSPFGVVDTSGNPKPSFSSYQLYARSA